MESQKCKPNTALPSRLRGVAPPWPYSPSRGNKKHCCCISYQPGYFSLLPWTITWADLCLLFPMTLVFTCLNWFPHILIYTYIQDDQKVSLHHLLFVIFSFTETFWSSITYIYVCTIHTHTHTHAHTYIYVCICECVCLYIYVYVYTYTDTRERTHTNTNTHMYVCMCVCVCVCVCVSGPG